MDKLHQSLFSLFFPPRSNPFYEPRTSSPVQQDAGGPSPDVASSQKRRAPPPPGTSPGLGPSLPPHKPTSGPDGERAQPVGPSPVAAMIGRELASSSPKVRSPCWNVKKLDLSPCDACEKYRKKCTVAVSAAYHYFLL